MNTNSAQNFFGNNDNYYARKTTGSICRYKEDGLVSRPPAFFTSVGRPMHGRSCPKSQLKSTCLIAKFGSLLDHAETGEKTQNVIGSSVQHLISLIFAIHVSFIIHLSMRPPAFFTSVGRPMHGTSCPKSQFKSTCLIAKFGSLLDHTKKKTQNVISSSVQHLISLIFAIHVSFIIHLSMRPPALCIFSWQSLCRNLWPQFV